MTVITKVVAGKVPGHYSFECNLCGHCGGNYATREQAQTYAEVHANMIAPDHR